MKHVKVKKLREMDASERLANQYLLALNRGNVVFEPDGNIPPDFSVSGIIGVEVRRLNQNYSYPDGSMEGLEQLSIPIWQRLEKELPSIGPSIDGESWFVGIDFRRPIDPRKLLWPKIRKELITFMTSADRKQCTISVTDNFNLDLIRASKDCGSFFLLGASSDDDEGGWVMGEVEKNLRFCIEVKEKKIAPYRQKYTEWWLILPDYIDYSMELQDRDVFRTDVMPNLQHSFNKIIFLDPRDHSRAFEI